MRSLVLLIALVGTASAAACDPRQLPGFKQEAQRQAERINRETNEAIKKSPALQELARLCTEEIPRPQGFVETRKYKDHENRLLGYHYRSRIDYPAVKSFYLDYFSQHGWQLTRQKDGGWGPSQLEFRNDRHRVIIDDKGQSDGTYGVACARL